MSNRLWALGIVLIGALAAQAMAQAEGAGRGAATRPAASATTRPSSEQVLQEMRGQVERNPLIEPTQRSAGHATARSATAAPTVGPGPGVAPGMRNVKLRREGEMVLNRKGRLSRSAAGGQALFIFESDNPSAPEPPMVLVPCKTLQNMEEIVIDRGDRIAFILSGQVFEYRNENHLLPTVMKLAVDRGNLEK